MMNDSVQLYLETALSLLEDACDDSEDTLRVEITEIHDGLSDLLKRRGVIRRGQRGKISKAQDRNRS